MKVVIPSRGRPSGVRTLEHLVHDDITLVVPKDEVTAYARYLGETHPDAKIFGVDCANIMEKRQWILDKFSKKDKIVMMDDDLRFRVRRTDGKFVAADNKDVSTMLYDISKMLDVHCHGGISDEFMCQNNPPGHATRRRYNQVLAYNFVGRKAPRFRLTINEEHDMHLQLLAQKHAGFVLTDYTKGSKYNASGGCSIWRTPELERAQFAEFARLWPDLVSVVPAKNSISGQGVRVAWRRA